MSVPAGIILNQVPSELVGYLQRLSVDPSAVEFVVQADLDLEGHTHTSWLIGTADVLAAVTPELPSEHQVIGPIRLAEVEKVRTFPAVGSAFFQVKVHGLFLDLARFSNACREPFNRIARQLENRRKGDTFRREALAEPDSRLCPACSLPLPARGAACPRCAQQGGMLKRAYALLSPYKRLILGLVGMMLVVVILELLPPFLIGKVLVDKVLKPIDGSYRHSDWLIWVVLSIAGASMIGALLNVLIGRTSSWIGTRVTYDLRARLQDKLMDISVDYYDRNSVGSLMSRVLYDVEYFHQAVNQIAQGFLVNVLKISGIGIMLFLLSWKLALLVMIPIPLVVIGTMFFWRFIYPRYFKLWDGQSKLAALMNGLLSGIRLVKAFAQERRERGRFRRMAEYLRDSRRGLDMSTATFNPIMAFVFGLGGLIVWYAGGQEVIGGLIGLGTLVSFLTYVGLFYGPIQQLTMFSNWVTGFLSSCQRVFEIMDVEPGIPDPPGAAPMEEFRGRIEFRNVSFGYDPYDPVIKDVSFTIEPGQMIGIVGKSGSGKTTLVNLLCRFYDVQQGQVLIDGRDVREIPRADLRKQIGLVLQEPFLFRSSIANNIAYGRPEAPPAAIIDASKAAYSHNFIIKLPGAYDTRLGERGAGLSGGERQRVSIARALLCDPRVLILDEATSSVDTEAEMQIQNALNVLCKGRTTIAIAHRLSTLRGADRIIVMDSGQITEQGTHDELMKIEGGTYANLVKIQTQLAGIEQDET
ncbi:MAG: Vitamin B12 import ATP-binding protein BtuD [Phycisphaerae bacterium]|nr:Vitamin B12 import ATP-binding protein BtuD [Phycisphaerae bacterium]